ncbi:MAG: hypothetical protein E6902_14640 [Paeniclostridium sordellii]|nr:hypothetical protein [Paeniclostridium sordellii]
MSELNLLELEDINGGMGPIAKGLLVVGGALAVTGASPVVAIGTGIGVGVALMS